MNKTALIPCFHSLVSLVLMCAVVACGSDPASEGPAELVMPAPIAQEPPSANVQEPAAAEPVPKAPDVQPSAAAEKPRIQQPAADKPVPAKITPDKPKSIAVAEPSPSTKPEIVTPEKPSAPPQPEVVAPKPVPVVEPVKPVATTKVIVPHTDHVHVDVPAGLQRWLDEDDRMLPWLGKVIAVIDKCYAKERAKSATAAGTIVLRVVMHENARPDAEVQTLPPALSGVVACATGGLMNARMPLFTGTEGQSHKVNVRFSP